MRRHSDRGSTQDLTASLLFAACHNYELLSIVVCMYVACKIWVTLLQVHDSVFILPVMCKCCMGPLCALVPMITVHFNND